MNEWGSCWARAWWSLWVWRLGGDRVSGVKLLVAPVSLENGWCSADQVEVKRAKGAA